MAEAKSMRGSGIRRPLSPHLQIYRPQVNMVMSILHRITGAGLYLGSVLLACWLVAAAMGPDEYNFVAGLFDSLPGRILLFGFTWALFHHMMGGIRHLIWDTGRGLEIASVNLLSWATIVSSVALTLAVWAVAIFLV